MLVIGVCSGAGAGAATGIVELARASANASCQLLVDSTGAYASAHAGASAGTSASAGTCLTRRVQLHNAGAGDRRSG